MVNNVETLASVPPIVANGADWYRALGLDEHADVFDSLKIRQHLFERLTVALLDGLRKGRELERERLVDKTDDITGDLIVHPTLIPNLPCPAAAAALQVVATAVYSPSPTASWLLKQRPERPGNGSLP